MIKKLLTYCFVILFGKFSFAQQSEGSSANLPKFYKNKLHFGFSIAYNNTDFRVHTVKNSAFPDTLIGGVKYGIKSIYTKSDPGFALGIICDVRLHEYIRLRFTPNISFASRSLQYTLENDKRDSVKKFAKSVESTFLIFPLEAKLQSKRLGNFGAYVIGGGGYTLDLASRKKGQPSGGSGANEIEDAVRLKRDDFFYSGGAGTDFYLKYFKLGLELKLLMGTRNLLQSGNNIFSNSLQKVNSRMVIFSITFEG
ncbi:MAG: outer membrane beta-barrel protein [Bacteroidetes bacterium]|nr:outer membrane beta-barrel protein [Bacteroidota bacterium]